MKGAPADVIILRPTDFDRPVVASAARPRARSSSPGGTWWPKEGKPMRISMKFGVRFIAMIVFLALLSIANHPSVRSDGPYQSALSSVATGSDANAAPGCKYTRCGHPGSGNTCVSSPYAEYCVKVSGTQGGCNTLPC